MPSRESLLCLHCSISVLPLALPCAIPSQRQWLMGFKKQAEVIADDPQQACTIPGSK